MISLVRVDNRLVHGQVIEGWLPHLKVRRVVVLDRQAARDPLVRAAMALAVPPQVKLELVEDEAALAAISADGVPTLVLFRDVAGAYAAAQHGLALARLNLGNIHFKSGRHPITASVFLDGDELAELETLSESGVEVEAQALPGERPLGLPEIEARFKQSPPGPAA